MRICILLVLFLITSCIEKEKEILLNKLDGTEVKLSYINTEEYNAYVFLSPECPLSEASLLELNRLDSIFNKEGYATNIIIPGELFSVKEISIFRDSFAIQFPIYMDKKYQLCDLLKATITPEYFLYSKNNKLLYSGAIDDRALDNDIVRQKASRKYVEEVMQLLINKKPLGITNTKAVGCFIER